jgi:hypothetical protein
MELLPCPHCGGEADFNNDGDRWDQVICGSCGCRGTEYPNSREKAAAAWNRRVSRSANSERLYTLNEVCESVERVISDMMARGEICSPTEVTDAMIESAWNSYQNTGIDLLADSDEETKKCMVSGLKAALAAMATGPRT